jgi:beta-galactosidase/beta-glucuronidase
MKKDKMIIKGKLTSCNLKNKELEIVSTDGMYYNTNVLVNGEVLKGVQKITIVMEVEMPSRVIIDCVR